jgi:hypothetical protein
MIQIERKCDRCGRQDPLKVNGATEAVKAEQDATARKAIREKLLAFLQDIPAHMMPAAITVLQAGPEGKPYIAIYDHLCGGEAKRSCGQRVSNLLQGVELPPKPVED